MIEVLDNKKVFINNGPIQMVLDISLNGKREPEIGIEVSKYLLSEFNELAQYTPYIKSNKCLNAKDCGDSIVLKKMVDAVCRSGDCSLTPLAAVAGSFSDLALEKSLEFGAERVIINNGGDIALKDITGNIIKVGIPVNNKELVLSIDSQSKINGICTSGIGGRSFTKGIATASVVLGETAAMADACATCIGNAADVESDGIVRCYAEEIDSETDIPGNLVTLSVGELSKKEIYRALLNGIETAEKLYNENIIKGSILCIKDKIVMFPENSSYFTLEKIYA
ncbi:UPF0280 family protein [Clostridium tyrobutyricum]|uniref:UPF0280 family protein n=1 Tax=Clostridium tyrobutyricum TaxID=1519 RepID=UPI00057D2849|nr:thiamine biosynthesis protein ApbE [Clostridium tyrobutyricum]MBV4417758.1 UPF0280 family protein [Clostridium tyrobutyricum]